VVALKVENTISGWLSSGKLVAPKGDNIHNTRIFNIFSIFGRTVFYHLFYGFF